LNLQISKEEKTGEEAEEEEAAEAKEEPKVEKEEKKPKKEPKKKAQKESKPKSKKGEKKQPTPSYLDYIEEDGCFKEAEKAATRLINKAKKIQATRDAQREEVVDDIRAV
jgi:hypothetical protein